MKVKRILGLALVGTLLLGACAGGPDKSDKTDGNVMIAYDNLKNASVTSKGALTIVDYKLKYQDFATGTTVYLCNKEGCIHNDMECDADVFDIQGQTAFFYDDQVYVIGLPNLEGFQLWKMNNDGTSRRKLIEKADGHGLVDMFVADNKVYYSAKEWYLEERNKDLTADEGFGIVGMIDLDKNKAYTLWEGREDRYEIEKMIVRGDGLYFLAKHRSDDYKKVTDEVLSDPSLSEEERIIKLIEVQSECELTEKVYYIDGASQKVEEKYSYSATVGEPVSLCGVTSKGILMQGKNGYFYTDNPEDAVYSGLTNIIATEKYVLGCDPASSEISVYDCKTESLISNAKIEPPEDYFDIEETTETEGEYDGEIPDYSPQEEAEREWFLKRPFYSDNENLFFDFKDNLNVNVWILKVSELIEGKCIWHRGV
ncbi:MAG: hypothetical protein IKO30_02405 [Lachnospiraceae bacterium]|nr:hypothetical protein [Lachnospiraceae bacterium]